jgi:23S rRNA pseudouridine1911/1915/1917 synthase
VEIVVDKAIRLDKYLAERLPDHSRTRIASHIGSGAVRVDGKPVRASFVLSPGMVITLSDFPDKARQELTPIDMDLRIVFEDEALIVVDKDAGISTHPSPTSSAPTLVHALLAHTSALSTHAGNFRPGIVHRLDKDTSGLLLVAKTDLVHRRLQAAIQSKAIERKYWAFVRGKPAQSQFTIKSYLGRHPVRRKEFAVVSEHSPGSKNAVTHCRLVQAFAGHSQLECILETGRTHQIRVHLSSVGLPVLGDAVYGVTWPGIVRQALHAHSLSFAHPLTGNRIALHSELPLDLQPLSVS